MEILAIPGYFKLQVYLSSHFVLLGKWIRAVQFHGGKVDGIGRFFPDDPAGIACCYGIIRNVARYDGACTDDHVTADADARENNDVGADPDVIADPDGWSGKVPAIVLRVVVGGDDLGARSYFDIGTHDDAVGGIEVAPGHIAGIDEDALFYLVRVGYPRGEVNGPAGFAVDSEDFLGQGIVAKDVEVRGVSVFGAVVLWVQPPDEPAEQRPVQLTKQLFTLFRQPAVFLEKQIKGQSKRHW